ncbi:MAG: MotA/TolQ/ExbB proton channel family protein [Vampirovibrionales bacterium]|nr:MotA/TolQ/ExbB proton channel family protein [Vampirovibrionales bacterium]
MAFNSASSNRATWMGLIGGGLILAGAVIIGHVPLHILMQPEAALIVLGGTTTAALISFSPDTLKGAWRAFHNAVGHSQVLQGEQLQAHIDDITNIASFVRKEGMLALAPYLDQIEQPFLRKGLFLITNNHSEASVRDALEADIDLSTRQALDESRVFETAGGFAPTMGLIGALIGLMGSVQSFDNPALLGQNVAGAFAATLYGVALANLVLLPLANKLREQARALHFQKTLLLHGLLSIANGEHPMLLGEKLNAYMRPSQKSAGQLAEIS